MPRLRSRVRDSSPAPEFEREAWLPFFSPKRGAQVSGEVAKRLCSGLQSRLDGFDSHPRLQKIKDLARSSASLTQGTPQSFEWYTTSTNGQIAVDAGAVVVNNLPMGSIKVLSSGAFQIRVTSKTSSPTVLRDLRHARAGAVVERPAPQTPVSKIRTPNLMLISADLQLAVKTPQSACLS